MQHRDSYLAAGVFAVIAIGICHGAQEGDFAQTLPADTNQSDTLLQSPATTVAGQPTQTPTANLPGRYLASPVANGASSGQLSATQSSSQSGASDAATPQVMVNQSPLSYTGAGPVMIDGQLMVPGTALAQQMGATVDWDNHSNTLEIDLPNQQPVTIQTFGDDAEDAYDSDYSAFDPDQFTIIDGRAYIPVDELPTVFNGTRQ
jgi:hypothetical protein